MPPSVHAGLFNQGVFEATKNYFRADDMTSAQGKLFKFNHFADRGLDQSMINIQDKLAFQSGGEFAKDATSSIIQPRFRSGGVLTINVTSLIESGSDQELQAYRRLRGQDGGQYVHEGDNVNAHRDTRRGTPNQGDR